MQGEDTENVEEELVKLDDIIKNAYEKKLKWESDRKHKIWITEHLSRLTQEKKRYKGKDESDYVHLQRVIQREIREAQNAYIKGK